MDGDKWEHDVFFTDAFAAETGELLWQDRHIMEYVGGATIWGERLLVAGANWQTRVYDVGLGLLMIDEPELRERLNHRMLDVAADDERWFLVGELWPSGDGPDDADFSVRAYTSETD